MTDKKKATRRSNAKKKKKLPTQERIQLYLPHSEREMWERAVVISDKYDSFSSMCRDLVRRHYKKLVKKMGDECPD